MSSNGAPHKPAFRVTLDQQRLAVALAKELSDKNATVHAEDGSWIVSIDAARTDQAVLRVLDAIRDTLATRPSASAHVLLDGNEYVMHSEDNISITAARERTTDETSEGRSDTANKLPARAADAAAA